MSSDQPGRGLDHVGNPESFPRYCTSNGLEEDLKGRKGWHGARLQLGLGRAGFEWRLAAVKAWNGDVFARWLEDVVM